MCGALVGIGIVLPSLSSCSTLASIQTNITSGTVAVPKEKFTPESKVVLIKNAASEFDIAVIEISSETYKAFYSIFIITGLTVISTPKLNQSPT